MNNIRVVHLAITPVAGSPWNTVSALNTHTNVAARLVILNPNSYGQRTFPEDLVWERDRDECLSALAAADVVHMHQWFDPGVWFGPVVGAICAKKICLRQFHSMPELYVGNDPTAIAKLSNDPTPQLVIAQFHERYYPRARVVPNLVPLNDPLLTPVKSSMERRPHIAWSPTSRELAYASRWETKGYPETLHLLQHISRKVPCTIDVIENAPRDDCLRRRADASLVVDELVTGSYHLSGLEGLAQGKPVLGWLDARVQFVLRELTGANTLPWVNTHLEDAENVLLALLADPDLCQAIGAESRVWMERWYSDKVMVQHYVQAYRDLLERPDMFSQGRKDDLAIHWRNVQLPDLVWEARRNRAKSNRALASCSSDVMKNDIVLPQDFRPVFIDNSVINRFVLCLGLSSVLCVGDEPEAMLAALLLRGVDARDSLPDASELAECLIAPPEKGNADLQPVKLAFLSDGWQPETVLCSGQIDALPCKAVQMKLKQFHFLSRKNVVLFVTSSDVDGELRNRAWWEAKCFEAGFRKHPAYYRLNDYESLNKDNWQICIPLEKIPSAALVDYPLASLNEERGLHMDMTRDSGERSDAHIIRYQWACNYIKPGDRVLDAACGLGYGGHVVRHLTAAAKVIGIDGSDFAIDYATKAFPCAEERAEYRVGKLPADLSEFPDGSFEVIISFETLEHVEQPQQLLQEFYRLLTPSGRVVVSVPNDWSDETGEDPNPFHLHVYDWNRLKSELAVHFILENAFAQTASQCKIAEKGGVWERRPRSLKQVTLSEHPPEDCEWWLMTAMKSPLEYTSPYEERVFANIATSGHPSIRYSEFFINPWLMNAMVNLGCRLKNDKALEDVALSAMSISPKSTNDYAAALCVMAYRILDRCFQDSAAAEEIISKIDAVTANPPSGPMGFRWKVSLLFIKAKLLQTLGDLGQAKMTFVECASHDVRCFGIHLATKTTEAWFMAGRLAHAMGDTDEARSCWERGVESGAVLLSVSIDDILVNRSFPNRFNHGDGVREYTLSWDNIARCANGLHLLKQGRQFDYTALDNCFQSEYSTVTRDLFSCRSQLLGRTEKLVETRQILVERTARLEQCNTDLLEITRDLVETRQTLVERTALLEQANKDLLERTEDLMNIRQTLVRRTKKLVYSVVSYTRSSNATNK